MSDIKLTKLASCAGCGAKVGAGMLAQILGDIPVRRDENLLVGFDTSDDAAVYRINEDLAMVQTVDFFPPIADDPYTFGQIAAANALSDIYAMGGEPKTAMNLLCIPKSMDTQAVHAILAGGYDKVYEAGAVIAGGHSIYDEEPKYGLSVTGFVHPDKLLRNNTPKIGDVLILTKPLGVGVLTTAAKGGLVDEDTMARLYKQMATLNKYAAEAVRPFAVHSCTDVTGFGLMGHLSEMCADGVTAVIDTSSVPFFCDEVFDFAKMGILPEGLHRNRKFAQNFVDESAVPLHMADLMYDPQTSGGLLLAIDSKDADGALEALKAVCPTARIIGHIEPMTTCPIVLK